MYKVSLEHRVHCNAHSKRRIFTIPFLVLHTQGLGASLFLVSHGALQFTAYERMKVCHGF